MTSRSDNAHYLRAAEQAHHADLTKRALDTIRALAAAGDPVNFSTVAQAAGCSRSFLATPSSQPRSDASGPPPARRLASAAL